MILALSFKSSKLSGYHHNQGFKTWLSPSQLGQLDSDLSSLTWPSPILVISLSHSLGLKSPSFPHHIHQNTSKPQSLNLFSSSVSSRRGSIHTTPIKTLKPKFISLAMYSIPTKLFLLLELPQSLFFFLQ